jgi:hypothetical protein
MERLLRDQPPGALQRHVSGDIAQSPVLRAPASGETDKALLKHREFLQSNEADGWKRFDEMLFKIDAGAMALSVALLGVLNERVDPDSVVWVYRSWTLLSLGLALLLTSLASGQLALRKAIRQIDSGEYRNSPAPGGVWADFTPPLNWAAAAASVAGLVLLLVFATQN